MQTRDRDGKAPSRWHALIASVVIAITVVTSFGALSRLSGPALAAATPPPANGDTSGGGNIVVLHGNMPKSISKPATIAITQVPGIGHFTVHMIPVSKPANKHTIQPGASLRLTLDTTTGLFAVQVIAKIGRKYNSLMYFTPALEFVPPTSTVSGKIWQLQMLTSKGWAPAPFTHGYFAVTRPDIYQWVLVTAPSK